MIRRRAVLAGIAGTLASRPVAPQTPLRDGTRRLGVLMANRANDSVAEAYIAALTKGLRGLDWSEGESGTNTTNRHMRAPFSPRLRRPGFSRRE